MSVVAGAGSGKTRTAIQRVLCLLRVLPNCKHVALLSFSNVAVETFREGFVESGGSGGRICIATFDSYFTQHVVLSYSWRLMGCAGIPYLVQGDEAFLNNYRIYYEGRPHSITDLNIEFENGTFSASLTVNYSRVQIPWASALIAIQRLGLTGAYTHSIGRYWVLATLTHFSFLPRLLAERFPHLIVDEAQDIGGMHWAILQILRNAGAFLTLIGDYAQAIFSFNGADGSYLRLYLTDPAVNHFHLTTNFRSVPSIVACANALANRADLCARENAQRHSGAFVIPYDPNNPREVIQRFEAVLEQHGYAQTNLAVISRASALVNQIRGGLRNRGAGLMKQLVKAVDHRHNNEYKKAFRECLNVVNALLDPPIPHFISTIEAATTARERFVRSRIWSFTCDSVRGLPAGLLNARDPWHPTLLENFRGLLAELMAQGLIFTNPGLRLTTRDLLAAPLIDEASTALRVDTVHQVKGESIDGVLYVATSAHVRDFLNGIGTEDGRIGYVALTRAKNVFWLAIPESSYPTYLTQAIQRGMVAIPAL